MTSKEAARRLGLENPRLFRQRPPIDPSRPERGRGDTTAMLLRAVVAAAPAIALGAHSMEYGRQLRERVRAMRATLGLPALQIVLVTRATRYKLDGFAGPVFWDHAA